MVYDFVTKLTKREALSKNVYLFEFSLIEPEKLEFVAGQYMLLKVEGQYRQFSIVTPTNVADRFDLVVEIFEEGLASNYLKTRQVGDHVKFKGPAGVFTLHPGSHDVVFLATGTGIAPIKSMIESELLKETGKNMFLYWGLRYRDLVYFDSKFKELEESHSRFFHNICLSREEGDHDFRKGRVDKCFKEDIEMKKASFNDFDYYLCGAPDSVEGLRRFSSDLGVPDERIFFEKFARHG